MARVAPQIFTYAENWNHVCLAGNLLERDQLGRVSAHYRTSLQSENEPRTTATRGLGDVAMECAEAKRLLPRVPRQLRARRHSLR